MKKNKAKHIQCRTPAGCAFHIFFCSGLLLMGVCQANTEPAHPSLLFTPDTLAQLRGHVKSGWMAEAYEVMRTQADGFMNEGTGAYPAQSATAGRRLNVRISTLALTGLISGDERYCNRAAEILVASARASTVQDYVKLNHHLAVGDGAHAYAMGYDWLYAYLTDEQRELIRDEIYSFGTWLYEYSMKGRDYGNYDSKRNLSCNHNAVVHGGLGLCALVLGEHPEWRNRAEMFVRAYLEYARDETGYNYEGIGYYAYGSWGSVPFGVALDRAGHGDIFEGVASLPLIPNYILRQMVPVGDELVAMNDSGGRLGSSGGFIYLLSRFQDRVGLWAWLKLYGAEGSGFYGSSARGDTQGASLPYVLLFADPTLEPQHPDEADLPLHTFFERGSASFRSGWGEMDAMATFTCGYDRHRGHNQQDENSFAFFARGERFVIDPGYHPVSTRCHNSILINGMGQGPDKGEYDVNGRTESVQEFDSAWATTGSAAEAFPETLKVEQARRKFLFVNAATPYLVIADDLETGNSKADEFTWLLHTDRTNRIDIDERNNTAYIKGARRGAVCMVKFIKHAKRLEVSETNLSGKIFKSHGKKFEYSELFKELSASYSARTGRFTTVISAADCMEDLPEVRWDGAPDNMRIGVRSPDGRIDLIHITPESIDFRKGEVR